MRLRDQLAQALDPVQIARKAGIDPDPWQTDVLRSDAQRLLLNCSRQTGKSTIAAIRGLHRAAYVPRSLVLLLSPSLRQSQELFRKVVDAHKEVSGAVPSDQLSALRLELPNGSRIVSLPGTERTTRGFSGVSLLIIDEAARVPDELYRSVRPMLAVSGGDLIAMSTPWGRRGWFWEEWEQGEGWERVRVPASECPRIGASFLADERRALGSWWFRQEYDCAFEDTVEQIFSTDLVESLFVDDVTPLFPEAASDKRLDESGLDESVEVLFEEVG